MPTHTGQFAIGFRQGRSDWNRGDIAAQCSWSKQAGFQAMDLRVAIEADIAALRAADLKLGTVDLLQMGEIAAGDRGKRKELLDINTAYIQSATSWGVKTFFTVIGGEPGKTRNENYRSAVEAFSPLAEIATSLGATIAFEAYPGMAPHYAMLCTTPETTRAFLKDIPKGMAINYDPSHYIRLGVDHIRFLKEFAPHVVHVHGKDTQLFPEAMYEYGMYQPSAFEKPRAFGEQVWRYTIPGNGVAKWGEIFSVLKSAGYAGAVSVELEDEEFNGTEEGEKKGLVRAMEFLRGIQNFPSTG